MFDFYMANSSRKNNPHPAPFPIELPVRCIYSVLDEQKEKLVIDPYCGSGTTLVAAKILGHSYIGIDISKDYCEFSKKRLLNFMSEIHKVNSEISKRTINKTFKERKEKGEFTGKYSKALKNENEEDYLFKIDH